MNPWYLSDSPAVSPSCPFILHINCAHNDSPSHLPSPPLTEISKMPEQSWQQHGDCSCSLRTSLKSMLEADSFWFFCTWYQEGTWRGGLNLTKWTKLWVAFMAAGWLSHSMWREKAVSNFSRLPGGWFIRLARGPGGCHHQFPFYSPVFVVMESLGQARS